LLHQRYVQHRII
jgi:hypothetical protein